MTLPEVKGVENSVVTPREEVLSKQLETSTGEGKPALPSRVNDARSRVMSYMSTKPMSKMVLEAVGAIGNVEKGASVQAITKWIIANYAVLDVDKVKYQVKKAILKSLENESIVRSETSKNALGASGSFILPKKTSPAKKKTGKPRKTRDLTSNPLQDANII